MSVLTHQIRGRTGGTTGSLAWLLVLGIVLAALNLRTAVTSIGPVLDQITIGLRMTTLGVGMLTTLPVLVFASVGALTPALARKVGEHRLLLFSLLLLGSGLLIRSMVGSAEIFLYSSALALSGGAVGNVLIPSLIKRHFPGRTGTMTTVYTTALAVGTMLAAAATVPIQQATDGNWHVAIGVWGALAAVAAIPWLALARSEPERRGAGGGAGARALLRSRLAWAVAAYFGTQSMVAYIMFGFLPKILIDGGHTPGQAGMVLGVFTAIGIPVSLLVPWIASRFSDHRPVVVTFVAFYTVGFLGLWLAPSALAWVFASLVGVGMGSFPLALTMLAMRTRTAEATAALSAFGQSTGYLIAGAGPLVIGFTHESTGGWTLPFLLLFGVVAVQLVAGWYAGRPGYLEDERALARR